MGRGGGGCVCEFTVKCKHFSRVMVLSRRDNGCASMGLVALPCQENIHVYCSRSTSCRWSTNKFPQLHLQTQTARFRRLLQGRVETLRDGINLIAVKMDSFPWLEE
jgi:hypothetical protein